MVDAWDLQVGLASDPGRVRERNEDCSLALQFTLAQQGQPPLPVGLFVVADGMGGHLQGQQASALAVRLAARHVINQVYLPFLGDDEQRSGRAPIHEVLEMSVQIAHQAVMRQLPNAGTTMTMAMTLGDGVYIAHVGDSRAYIGERGYIRLLTRDHSMAARLLEMGHVTADEVASQRNILYKALGQGAGGPTMSEREGAEAAMGSGRYPEEPRGRPGHPIEPDILTHNLSRGQYLLLCCDGLWTKVSDEEISALIDASPTAGSACRRLVDRANEKGGEDNISVILAARGWPLAADQESAHLG